jgi:predicted RNase H-like nuclease (RuvC/YqgF family)
MLQRRNGDLQKQLQDKTD